ncbi:class I SAM-dependent methyltransferase [Blastopirellula sp. JC732]|uniref:Class I SAM-dependent methyltransferase n=1 Tax=Blastopirellula sediminis TaxID=2894196 RepID=A0A9X1MTA0_9BACT|nr:class I SAM-dependent methyltransferase [Blastopirellula sediminis]MCC9604502.1 class I SAM-dependent methyltransferase [Blastopirellula sediminis]MCC9632199.1 class I SAM-dependent methyltransferase [Blastopirellula sediminis]
MPEIHDWNQRYLEGNLPWDTGLPSTELQKAVMQHKLGPCRVLDIGCGTGTNSLWLAEQGFEVTGIDLAPLAIERAEQRARDAHSSATFAVVDILTAPLAAGPFDFFFDRGCYHAVRREAPHGYAPAVARLLAPGACGLILAGNANEPHDPGPPVVSEKQIREELGTEFEIIELHEFRFDPGPMREEPFLAWSCWVEKR